MARPYKTLYWLMIVAAICLISFARVRNTESDSRAVLLTSESILLHGTIRLDAYGAATLDHFGYTVDKKNGHYYGTYPIGSSIASLPFVALAHGWGLSMLESQGPVQIAIACFTAAVSLMLLAETALLFLPVASALSLTAVFWFGTSFASTMGTALWSHNFAVLFALAAIHLALKAVLSGNYRVWPAIGFCLFFAYLCRPTLALLSPFALLFLFTYNRPAAIKSGIVLALFLAGFVGFSFHSFHQALPDYYLPQKLAGAPFLTAIYGNSFSPSRGLLVFSPFLPLAWFCRGMGLSGFKLKWSWLLIGLAWPLAHLEAMCRFPCWWGGWSFGPRFMSDALPGLFLLTVRTWPVRLPARFGQWVALGGLTIAAILSIDFNSAQALYNRYTYLWNQEPDSGAHQEVLLDWHFPQFLHNRARHAARLEQWYRRNGAIAFTLDGNPAPLNAVMLVAGQHIDFAADGCFTLSFRLHDWSGMARLRSDDKIVGDYDLYAPQMETDHRILIVQEPGPHHYVLEALDQKNPASAANQVLLDGIFAAPTCK